MSACHVPLQNSMMLEHESTSDTLSITDLGLDDEEEAPRRLVPFPTGQIVGFGGDNGTLVLLPDDLTSEITKRGRPFRRYDDEAVRAVAVSPDGRRVIVGFDDGSTTVYAYADFTLGHTNTVSSIHPFLTLPQPSKSSTASSIFDSLLSQSDDVLPWSTQRPGEKTFSGVRFAAPIRDLQFLNFGPESLGSVYWCMVVSEAGVCAVDLTSPETIAVVPRYWEEATKQAHEASGIRSICIWSPFDQHNNNAANNRSDTRRSPLATTLAMDGRLCLWDLCSATDPSKWKLLRREVTPIIPKPDIGELLGADVYDRSCRGAFLSFPHNTWSVVAVLPGAPYLQMRSVAATSNEIVASTDANQTKRTPDDAVAWQGHLESIVTVASSPRYDEGFVATAGRDGRVVIWNLRPDKNKVRRAIRFIDA
jgi:WD40 repeat protein